MRCDGDTVYFDTLVWTMDQAKRYLKDQNLRWVNFVNAKDMEKEQRIWDVEFRINKEGTPKVAGLAAVFGKLSENLGGFREQIKPGAFDGVLDNDVRALKNHNPDFILGRTRSGTLRLSITDDGLAYEYDDPDTSYSRDLIKSMERGDVNQSSFAFQVDEDKWDEDQDGRMIRTITKFKRLFDVSPVTYPAYPDTTVAKRSMDLLAQQKAEMEMAQERATQDQLEVAAKLREIELKSLSDK